MNLQDINAQTFIEDCGVECHHVGRGEESHQFEVGVFLNESQQDINGSRHQSRVIGNNNVGLFHLFVSVRCRVRIVNAIHIHEI